MRQRDCYKMLSNHRMHQRPLRCFLHLIELYHFWGINSFIANSVLN